MALIKWKKPSGLEIETNDFDATVKYAESLGWVRAGKVGRPRKVVAAPIVEPIVEPVVPVAVPAVPVAAPAVPDIPVAEVNEAPQAA